MKTSEKLLFPKLENEFLENILRQLVNQYNVIQMFFTKQPSGLFSCLVIHVEKNADAQELQQIRWVKKVRTLYKIDVCFIYSQKFYHRLSLGHPFFRFYCQTSSLIFPNEESTKGFDPRQDWKKFKKKFNVFQNHFYNDHDLHKSQVQSLISEGSSNSIFTTYGRLIEYDLEYLEELYLGTKSDSLNLDERINNLIEYIPAIQKYFVRKSRNKFYLTGLLAEAKEASADDEEIYKEQMYEAVGIAEQNLFSLIEKRLSKLKALIKKGLFKGNEVSFQIKEESRDITVSMAIETILNSVEVEQIYLYHQTTCYEKTTYYLMLITSGAGNEKLKLISKSLKSKMEGKCDFVLLSHSRYWIQNNLYQYQSFFFKIIKESNLIYSSSQYLPEFHWEMPQNPYHADLYFYYKSTKKSASQYFAIAKNEEENYQGLESLFALFFMSFCRTYIFVKTYYLPNYLSNQILWELCIYADADFRKYNYLIEHFWTDFFPYIDRNTTVRHTLSNLNKEQVFQMNTIIEKLIDVLQNLVVENGLLKKDQLD